MNTIAVEVVTPDRIVYRGDARIVVARGIEGDLGILPNHIPMVTPLKIAPVLVKKQDDKEDEAIAVSGGIMEVRKDKVTILAETAELGEEIDVARAIAAKERAERLLAESKDNVDFKRAELALERALARISAGRK
ncbi:F0F1 ATP synthase subunit epsilon [Aneurinibacillus terranovensis]|uniref:F0F1 ATP synthase subunit epsilon n=1 Tax=Aneurinibacillus terranovensis TaxID=278991 RepID=UPI00040EB397|nr:F0F1 ATP synthase subunit epsilon [Aneurinibacillus terranovensis]